MLTVSACLLFYPPLRAEEVVSFKADGVLTLNDGSLVRLAGVELPPESASLLAVLLGGKQVEIEKVESEITGTEPLPVYVYVQTSEIPQPHPADIKAREKRIMINELLLRLGAARMLESESGKHREDFESAQTEAKNGGQGIWSYEEPYLPGAEAENPALTGGAEPGPLN